MKTLEEKREDVFAECKRRYASNEMQISEGITLVSSDGNDFKIFKHSTGQAWGIAGISKFSLDSDIEVAYLILGLSERAAVAKIKASQDHTHYWYAERSAEMHKWVREQDNEDLKALYFSIIANGTPTPFDQPTFAQQFNSLIHKCNAYEKALVNPELTEKTLSIWQSKALYDLSVEFNLTEMTAERTKNESLLARLRECLETDYCEFHEARCLIEEAKDILESVKQSKEGL